MHLAAESDKTDTVEALIKHGADVNDKNQVSYMYMYIYEEKMICSFKSFLLILLLSFVDFFLYCKWYAMFSFCRKGILPYILLLNLVKQIQ